MNSQDSFGQEMQMLLALCSVRRGQDALAYVDCLNAYGYLGYIDWRLPNLNELSSLINYGQLTQAAWLNSSGGYGNPFVNVQNNAYWTSTTRSLAVPSNAWVVEMNTGIQSSRDKLFQPQYVWPVRGHPSCLNGPVWLGENTYAQSIQKAYEYSNQDSVFQLQDVLLEEFVILSGKDIQVSLFGGYNCSFSSQIGFTQIYGISIESGTVLLDRIVLQGGN